MANQIPHMEQRTKLDTVRLDAVSLIMRMHLDERALRDCSCRVGTKRLIPVEV